MWSQLSQASRASQHDQMIWEARLADLTRANEGQASNQNTNAAQLNSQLAVVTSGRDEMIDTMHRLRAQVLEKSQKDNQEKANIVAEGAKRKAVEDAANGERLAKEAEENKNNPRKESDVQQDTNEEKRLVDLELKKKADAENQIKILESKINSLKQ